MRFNYKIRFTNFHILPFFYPCAGDMDIDDDMCDEDMADSDIDDHSTTEDDAKSGVSRQSKGKNGSSHGNSSSKPRR